MAIWRRRTRPRPSLAASRSPTPRPAVVLRRKRAARSACATSASSRTARWVAGVYFVPFSSELTLTRPGVQVFDSNTKGAPLTFNLGRGEVIKGAPCPLPLPLLPYPSPAVPLYLHLSLSPGWDLGVVGMQVGGERKLRIPAALAYGSQKIAGIPPNSVLNFDVKLVVRPRSLSCCVLQLPLTSDVLSTRRASSRCCNAVCLSIVCAPWEELGRGSLKCKTHELAVLLCEQHASGACDEQRLQ